MPVPFCTGLPDEHCCWVEGEVCEHLVEYDNRASDRRYACGLFLTIKEQFPNKTDEWVWGKVHAHPLYDRLKTIWAGRGIDDCGDYRGTRRADGGIVGKCCYRGWVWGSDGSVEASP